MTVYISGPMTGFTDLNFPAFTAAAIILRDAGFDVINPAELEENIGSSWVECMRVDIAALMDCDRVLMLPGWMDSRGARLERHIAVQLGMSIHYRIDELLGAARKDRDIIQDREKRPSPRLCLATERETFEAWIKSTVGDAFSVRRSDGSYLWDTTQYKWSVWQARAERDHELVQVEKVETC